MPASARGAGSADRTSRPARRAASAEDLAIAGLVPMSTVDWPGRLVATVFCQGCPWRCVYCHNTAILDPTTPGAVAFCEVEALLARRRGLLDGVVLSGGEATSQLAVVAAARRVRELGFAVGLHAGGAYPARLRELLGVDGDGARTGERLVDWVGFDVKAAPAGYEALVGRPNPWPRVHESLAALLASGVEHELRMTVTPALIGQVAAVVDLVAEAGGRALVLQRARADGASGAFAAALGGVVDWPQRFARAVDAARELGARRGIEVSARG